MSDLLLSLITRHTRILKTRFICIHHTQGLYTKWFYDAPYLQLVHSSLASLYLRRQLPQIHMHQPARNHLLQLWLKRHLSSIQLSLAQCASPHSAAPAPALPMYGWVSTIYTTTAFGVQRWHSQMDQTCHAARHPAIAPATGTRPAATTL